MQYFLKKNILALIVPTLFIFRAVSEILIRLSGGHKLDLGEITFYLVAVPLSFGVVYLALEIARSQKLWPKIIFGFLFSLFIVIVVDYWLVLESYCIRALNLDPQGLSFLAALIGLALYGILSCVLLIPIYGVIKSGASKNSKILHLLPIAVPWLIGIIFLVLLTVTWGKYSNMCFIRPSSSYPTGLSGDASELTLPNSSSSS